MAITASGNGEGKADKLRAIKSADDLAANFFTNHEHAQRNDIQIVKVPDFLLQINAGFEFVNPAALADGNPLDSRHRWAHFCGSSRDLAFCQSDSISSMVLSSSVFPFLLSCSSIQPKRRRNLRLVLRRADSGSRDR